MEDPDHGWKPSGRPQSTIARNFSSELDDLFKLDGDLDSLDKNVHQKKQAVTTHSRELEELEQRLRATEERLQKAKSSPPSSVSRKDSQRRTPVDGSFPHKDKARLGEPTSPLAGRQRAGVDSKSENRLPERPRSARNVQHDHDDDDDDSSE